MVALAFLANIAVAWVVFVFGQRIAAVLGKGGTQAVSEVAGLLLTAIAVRQIIDGVSWGRSSCPQPRSTPLLTAPRVPRFTRHRHVARIAYASSIAPIADHYL